METKPYHHLPDGTFRNPPGSPSRDWSKVRNHGNFFKFFYEGIIKKKIFGKDQMPDYIPPNHSISEQEALNQYYSNNNPVSVTWLGHASFIIKIYNTVILTDPFLSDYAGPTRIGPKRFVRPGIRVNKLPKIDIILISHNHYDHLDTKTLKKIKDKKNIEVFAPLNLKSIIVKQGYNKVTEVDWYDKKEINGTIIKSLPAVHWSRRLGQERNSTLWCGYSIRAKNTNIYFSGDIAYGDVFSEIRKKAGPFELSIVPIGAYEPREMMQTSHVTPEEAAKVTKIIGSNKILGMHWGTIILSLEPIMEPPKRFKDNAKNYGYKKDDAVVFKIGQVSKLKEIID